MKFTALEEYGLRCLLHLAREGACGSHNGRSHGSKSLTLGDIALREGLTQQYAGKIFRILAKAGIVESERGRKGGYRLTRRPEDILLTDVLTALGGPLFDRKVCGRYTGDRDECVHTANCAVRLLWAEIQRSVDAVLVKTTLRDLVARERPLEVTNLSAEIALASVAAAAPIPVIGGRSPLR